MGAKGQPKTGGVAKGYSRAKKIKDALGEEGNVLKKAVTWLTKLTNKTKPTKDDEKTTLELFKIVLPYLERRMPQALEADVKANMTVLMMPGDEKL